MLAVFPILVFLTVSRPVVSLRWLGHARLLGFTLAGDLRQRLNGLRRMPLG